MHVYYYIGNNITKYNYILGILIYLNHYQHNIIITQLYNINNVDKNIVQ